MSTKPSDPLRAHVHPALAWQDAHATFDDAVAGVSPEVRGLKAQGIPYSPWQLLEHIRRTQHDILDFCVNPAYEEMHWPDDYWPTSAEPPTPNAWDESITAFRKDVAALQQLAADPGRDLFAKIPHGSGQTYLRELILVLDHNAYHVGQMVLLRRALGAWPSASK
ncbi:MAG: DinB family protein [Gemmatimonadaceae bacterium]